MSEHIDSVSLLTAIGKHLHKEWQLAKELQEFHVLHCPCRCPDPNDCNFLGNLRPERFVSFEGDGLVVFLTFKKARHASDLNKLLEKRTTIDCQLADDGSECDEDESSGGEAPCHFFVATLQSVVGLESDNAVVLTIVAMSGETLQVTLPADASVADAAALVKVKLGLSKSTVVHLLSEDEKLPLDLLLASMCDCAELKGKTRKAAAEGIEEAKEQTNATSPFKTSSRAAATGTSRGCGPVIGSDEEVASAAARNIILIRGVYERHNPEKLVELDCLMAKHVGEERKIYELVCNKYGEEPVQ